MDRRTEMVANSLPVPASLPSKEGTIVEAVAASVPLRPPRQRMSEVTIDRMWRRVNRSLSQESMEYRGSGGSKCPACESGQGFHTRRRRCRDKKSSLSTTTSLGEMLKPKPPLKSTPVKIHTVTFYQGRLN